MSATVQTSNMEDFNARYVRRKRLGAGAFGVVMRAFDVKRKMDVALKFFDARGKGPQSSIVQSFYREVELLQRLKNVPHIVDLYDTFNIGGMLIMSIQLVEGADLRKQELSAAHLRQIAHQGLAGLREIHRRGVVHGDIKAENILFSKKTGALIIDFGVSCFTHIDVKASRAKQEVQYMCSEEGADQGTPLFFSLDRFRVADGEKVSLETFFNIMRKDDLFAFGIVLYERLVDHQYEPNFTIGQLLNLDRVNELLRRPESMIPPDFWQLPNSPFRALVGRLLVSSHAQRPTANEALRILEGSDPAVTSSETTSRSSRDPSGRSSSSGRLSGSRLSSSRSSISLGSLSSAGSSLASSAVSLGQDKYRK